MNKRPMMIERDIMVKAYEIDCVGVVSNIVYIKWFEDFRHYFLDKYYPYKDMMKTHISPMLVKTEAEYKAPLTITDTPVGRSWATKMGKVKWEIMIEISCGGTVNCIGRQTGCFYDIANKTVARTPECLRAAYEREMRG